jgi:hypothetical protein
MTEEAGTTQMTDKLLAWRAGKILVLVNLVGAVIFDWLASYAWVIPQEWEGGSHLGTAGSSVMWIATSVPIFLCYFALNAGWGTLILGYRQWRSGRLWLAAFLIWLIALAIDYVHH